MENGVEKLLFVNVSVLITKLIKFIVCLTGVDCGPLPNIADGKVSIAPDTRLRSVATYSCRDGFVLKGYETRECQKDGTWSNEEPACERN